MKDKIFEKLRFLLAYVTQGSRNLIVIEISDAAKPEASSNKIPWSSSFSPSPYYNRSSSSFSQSVSEGSVNQHHQPSKLNMLVYEVFFWGPSWKSPLVMRLPHKMLLFNYMIVIWYTCKQSMFGLQFWKAVINGTLRRCFYRNSWK